MKKIILGILTISLLGISFAQKPVITNYSFKFKVKGLSDCDVFLGFHMGEQKYIKDTARVNSKGEVEFKGKDTLNGGIYLFITPRKNYFEFVVNETQIQMEVDTLDFIKHTVVKKSEENKAWYSYMQYIAERQSQLASNNGILKSADKKSKEYKDAQDALTKLNKEITDFRDKIIKEKPNLFVSKLFLAMKDVEIPESPKNVDGTVDSLFAGKYYKAHYWDHFDLSDERILRTPIFESKLKFYFDKMMLQIADTVSMEADKLLAKTNGNKDMFRFICHYVTYNFERSQIMCMDGVFVHMIEKYYKTGKASWVSSETLNKMIERSDKLKPLLCGTKLENITLPDTAGKWHNLYELKGDVTILYFWDATCSHCKKQTPILKELYETYLKPKGIEVFAVEGELEDKEWKKYVKENNLPWINVSDNPDLNTNAQKYIVDLKLTDLNSLNFRQTFDLYSYPVMYVLDKDKKVIAKKIGAEQLKDFLEKYFKILEDKKKGK